MKRKRILFGVIVLLIVGCSHTQEPIRIGVVGTMSGVQSDLSVSGRRGIEIAVDQINAEGGINGQRIELVVKNDNNDQEMAAELVSQFEKEGIEIVIGHYTSGMLLAAYEELLSHELLYIGPTVSADNLSTSEDNFIRFIASTKEQATVINQVAESRGQRKFAVIYDNKNIGFNESLYANFKSILETRGGEVVWDYGFDEINESSYVDIMEWFTHDNLSIESVFIIANANDLALIVQEMRNNDLDYSVYGPLWAHTNDLIRVGGESVNGVLVVSGIDYSFEAHEFNVFKEEYLRKYGEEITFSSIYSYESMMAVADALRSTGSSSWKGVKDYILERTFDGLQGEFYVDEYGDNTRAYMMDKIIDGEYRRVE